MIYLSIVLILCGVLLVMLSFLVSPQRVEPSKGDNFEKELPDIREEDLDLDLDFLEMDKTKPVARETAFLPDDEEVVPDSRERRREISPDSLYPYDDEHPGETLLDDKLLEQEEDPLADLSAGENDEEALADAILFEDSSGAIDYESGYGTIDPSRDKYRNIRRRGRGEISLEKEGVTFHLGRKLFRYDFYRVQNVHIGDNYAALVPVGESPVKLFIFPEPDSIIDRIADAFDLYRQLSSR